MAPRKATIKGSCLSCGTEMKKSDMSAHLASCPTRSAAIASSNSNSGTSERLFHLHVEALHEPEMWFDIEMRGGASLEDLEMYLLAIWLDCGCYHLSFFSKSQSQSFGPGLNMSGTIESTFQNENSKLFHSYDQQSSQCVITCQGEAMERLSLRIRLFSSHATLPSLWSVSRANRLPRNFALIVWELQMRATTVNSIFSPRIIIVARLMMTLWSCRWRIRHALGCVDIVVRRSLRTSGSQRVPMRLGFLLMGVVLLVFFRVCFRAALCDVSQFMLCP